MYGNAKLVNPASLLNHDSLIDDEAIDCTSPLDPMYEKPCVRSVSLVPFSVVDDRENSPDVKPITVDVEL